MLTFLLTNQFGANAHDPFGKVRLDKVGTFRGQKLERFQEILTTTPGWRSLMLFLFLERPALNRCCYHLTLPPRAPR